MNPSLALMGVVFVAWVASWALTREYLRVALSRGFLDVPNARSSHYVPTPRGGGVAFVMTVLVALPILGGLHLMPWNLVAALTVSGAIAAAVGYADDHDKASMRLRLGGHFAAAAVVLYFIGSSGVTLALGLHESAAWAGPVSALLYLVWMLNLTNFMDGIDGLAGVEVICVCVGGAVCAMLNAQHSIVWYIAPLLLASATGGFLVWNWHPARIFMGDAGSGFMGILLGALTLGAGAASVSLFWSWLILSGIFVVDATLTLVRRVVRGEKFYKAHRTHAYQHAAQRWGHARTTTAVAIINVVWLLPWAAIVALGTLPGVLALICAYAPLAIGALLLGAGAPDSTNKIRSSVLPGAAARRPQLASAPDSGNDHLGGVVPHVTSQRQ